MKRTLLAMAIPAVLAAGAANAAEIYNKDGNKLDFYGKIVGERGWVFSDESSKNSDSSYARIGLKGETQISSQLTGYAQWEYNVKADVPESDQKSATRLAFAGLNFGQFGSLDYGRNNGAVYDAEAATDNFVSWGGDGWNNTDGFMTGRGNGMLTYRNRDFFGAVDGLSFALQYQGKNENGSLKKDNGEGFSTSVSYQSPVGVAVTAAYANSNRTKDQKADNIGSKAEAAAVSLLYDANNVYAALMYAQTYNLVPQADGSFANKTKNIEALLQYQFDFGLRPSIGYLQSQGEDLAAKTANSTTFAGGKGDMAKYIEVGTWYYFNKNMNVYAAYQFNLLKKDNYTKAYNVATDDQMTFGITYRF